MIDYKGYTGIFEFDPELELFTGHVVDLRDEIYFEGESVDDLKASMKRAVDHYLKVCKQRKEDPEKPFSGKLNVRLGSDLHREVAVAAGAAGESINSWIVRVVETATADRQGSESQRKRTRGKKKASTGRPRKKRQPA